MTHYLIRRIVLPSLLLALSLASFGFVLMLSVLLYRYSKDLAEVQATFEHIQTYLMVGVLSLSGWWQARKEEV